MSLFPNWYKVVQNKGKRLTLFTYDVTKALLQRIPSNSLLYYQPPLELLELYAELTGQIWQARTQLYGGVEDGLYWNETFAPSLGQKVLDLQQSIFDASLPFRP